MAEQHRRRTNRNCPRCDIRHHPYCRATDATWPTAALDALVLGGREAVLARLGRKDSKPLPEQLTDVQADVAAIRLGYHPEQVWPGWLDAGLSRRDRAMVECGGWRQAWLWLEDERRARSAHPSTGGEVAA
jgi:hypothetical protein